MQNEMVRNPYLIPSLLVLYGRTTPHQTYPFPGFHYIGIRETPDKSRGIYHKIYDPQLGKERKSYLLHVKVISFNLSEITLVVPY